MKVFHCDHCGHLLFFENTQCVRCGHTVAYLPDLAVVGSLDGNPDGTWQSPIKRAGGRRYRLCDNYTAHNVCNWAIAEGDAHSLCVSCRLTRVIPDLSDEAHRPVWYRLEVAKRRLVFTLMALGLPVSSREEEPDRGLAFEFLADDSAGPVMTGHAAGVITVNIAEADDSEREKRRVSLNEPYRTLAGHLRHESGHYYWDRLIAGSEQLNAFRAAFGDERPDYGLALQRHYANGPAADWANHHISAYASAHPLEDWAETWAHYLHMVDTLETAAACGFSLRPQRTDEPALPALPPFVVSDQLPFDQLIERWFPLTYALNNLTRGLGFADAYPFVLSTAAVEKLRFVHDCVRAYSAGRAASPQPAARKPVSSAGASVDAPVPPPAVLASEPSSPAPGPAAMASGPAGDTGAPRGSTAAPVQGKVES
jgi:hypothetical protein